MAEFRFDINAADNASAKVDALNARIKSLQASIDGLSKSQYANVPGISDKLTADLKNAQTELSRLEGQFVTTFSGIEGFSTRAIAAMRGIPEAVAPAARALNETDKIMRAGSQDLIKTSMTIKEAIAGFTSIPAAKWSTKDLEEAFGGKVVNSLKEAGEEGTHLETIFGRVGKAGVSVADELARGQRGAIFSSISSMLRDTGALSAAVSGLATPWGAVAVAGVGALGAVAFAAEQAYQEIKSVRDTASDFALRGFGSGEQVRTGITEEFRNIKESGNEWAGTAKNIQEALKSLPPAAMESRDAIRDFGTGLAGLKGGDAAKEIEKLGKSLEHSPEAFAKLLETELHLEGATTSTGQTLQSLARSSNDASVAIERVTKGAEELRGPVLAAGRAGNLAKNELFDLALSAASSEAALYPGSRAAEDWAAAVTKAIDPTKNAGLAATDLGNAFKALDETTLRGNLGIQKRINLLEDLQRLQQAPVGEERSREQQSALENLSAEVDKTPPTAGETKRHQIELENIRVAAEARHADASAQLAAAQARTTEEMRFRTEVLTRPNPVTGQPVMNQGQAEAQVKESAEYQKLKDEEEILTRKVEEEKVAVVLAGINAQIASEARGSAEKARLQQEAIAIIKTEVDAGRKKDVELETARAHYNTFVRQALREEYTEAAKGYENQLRSAKGSYDEVTQIIQRWKITAGNYFDEYSVDFKRAMEDVERAGILAYRNIVTEAISSASSLKSANQDILSGFSHQQDARIKSMGSEGVAAAPGILAENISKARELADLDKAALDNAMRMADAVGNEAEKTKIYWDEWRLGIHTQTEILSLQDKIAEATKRAAQETINGQVAQLKLSEAIARSHGDLAAIVGLRIQEAELIKGNIYSTPAQKTNAQADIVNALTQEQNRVFETQQQLTASQERLGNIQINAEKARLQSLVSAHIISKAQMSAVEERFTETVFAQQEARVQAQINAGNLTEAQQEKLYEHLSELYAKDAEKQAEAQAKITADIEAENEKRKKAFTQLFDGIGSSLESSLSGLLTGQTTFAKAIQNVKNSIISGIVSTVSSVASEAAGKSLGPSLGLTAEQSKGGLGSVLGTALFKSLGLEKDVPQDAMKGVAEKWQKAVDAQGKATDLQAKAAQDLSKAAEALLNAAGGRGTGGGRSVAGGTASDESDYGAAGEYGGVGSDPRNKAGVVRAAAEKYGIDPDIGLRVARSEGLATFKGDNGTSFGAMQLHVGGGVGDRFRKETGLDPSDPKNEDATIDYAMKVAAKEGWGQWHGAALAGIKNWQGIGTGAGRDVPNGSVVDPPAWRATAADNPPEFTAAFGDSIAVGFKKVAGIGGNPVGGRNPAEVLASLNDTDLSKLEGKNVFLSSGASNINANRPDTTFAQQNAEMEQVKAQIARLQSEGAGVTLSGVGGGVANADQVNARLKQIAEDTGAGFTGQIAGTIGRVHPKEYNSLLEQASRVGNVGPTSRPHDVGATGEYGVGQGANQLKSSVDKLDSTTKFQTTTLTQANDNTQQLAGRITGTTQSDDQLKSATTDDKTATTSNTSAVQALTAKIGTTATGGVGASGNTYASPPVGLGGTTASQSNYDPFLGMNVTPGQNLGASSLNGGDGIAASMSGLSGGFSSLTGVLGVASSAASLFGGAAGKAASSILGTVTSIVGLVSKIGGMFGGGGGGGALGGIGSIFSGITGLFSLFALEQGGVIPSAAGGLSVNDGKGGTLAIVHPRETVLPAHLSTGIQNMISRGGGNDNGSSSSGDTHHYNINVNSIDSRSGAQFLMAHSDSIARSLNRARRNFNPAA